MSQLPPSIMICECRDGPLRGRIERVAVNAQFVDIVDRFDGVIPPQWYQVVTMGFGAKELRWARTSNAK